MKRNQSGFTLIEIAIVLVIIGLLLGGVLKGQELINSAKVKNLAGDFRNIPVMIYGYQDKYRALPGDDISALAHVSGVVATATVAGNLGNGVIDDKWDTSTQANESYLFWQHIRLAGLATGSTNPADADFLPRNAVGGQIGITNGMPANTPITALKGSYVICSNGILGKFAKQLDITMDDGNTATGSMMTATHVANAIKEAAVPAPEDNTTYMVCMGL